MPPRISVEVDGQEYLVEEQDMPTFLAEVNGQSASIQPPSPFSGLFGGQPSIPFGEQATPETPPEALASLIPEPMGLGAVAAGSLPFVGPWAYRMLPEDVRAAAQRSYEEQPYYSGATAIGTGLGASLLSAPIAAASKGIPLIGKGLELAGKYPLITNILGSAVEGAEQGAGEAVRAGGLTAALGLPLKGASKLAGMGEAAKKLPFPEIPKGREEFIAWAQENKLTPEQIQEALKNFGRFYKNVPSSLKEEIPVGLVAGGPLSTQATSLATKQTPESAFLYEGGTSGRFTVRPKYEGEGPIPQTPLQRAATEILGGNVPKSWQAAQRAGFETLEESGRRAQKEVSAEGLYTPMFREAEATVPLTAQETAAQRARIRAAETEAAKDVETFGRPMTLVPEEKLTKTITKPDPVLKQIAGGKKFGDTYQQTAKSLGIPEEDWFTQDSAKQVFSELQEVIKGKKYQGTELAGRGSQAKALRPLLRDRLVELNPDLPAADRAYAEAKKTQFNLAQEQRKTVRSVMRTLQKKEASADVGATLYSKSIDAGGLDLETFKGLIGQVRKQVGEEGVAAMKDSVAASLVRQINSEGNIKALNIIPKSTESVEKLATLFGRKKALEIEQQIKHVRDLHQLEQKAITGSKTGTVAAGEKSRLPSTDDMAAAIKTSKFAKSPAVFAKRVAADLLAKIVKEKRTIPFDEKQIGEIVFARGRQGARQLNEMKNLLNELRKTEDGRKVIRDWWTDHVDTYTGRVSRSLIRAVEGPGKGPNDWKEKIYE